MAGTHAHLRTAFTNNIQKREQNQSATFQGLVANLPARGAPQALWGEDREREGRQRSNLDRRAKGWNTVQSKTEDISSPKSSAAD